MSIEVSVVFKDPQNILPEPAGGLKGLSPPSKRYLPIIDEKEGHLGGDFARSRTRRLITEFAQFASYRVSLYELNAFDIVIDVKYPRVAPDARQHRPLEVLHQKGHIVTMLCRPDDARDMGVIFKFCPHYSICDKSSFKRVVSAFNEISGARPGHILVRSVYDPLHSDASASA